MLESLTRISKFFEPGDSEHKFHKMIIENWLSIDFELESPLHHFNLQNDA